MIHFTNVKEFEIDGHVVRCSARKFANITAMLKFVSQFQCDGTKHLYIYAAYQNTPSQEQMYDMLDGTVVYEFRPYLVCSIYNVSEEHG